MMISIIIIANNTRSTRTRRLFGKLNTHTTHKEKPVRTALQQQSRFWSGARSAGIVLGRAAAISSSENNNRDKKFKVFLSADELKSPRSASTRLTRCGSIQYASRFGLIRVCLSVLGGWCKFRVKILVDSLLACRCEIVAYLAASHLLDSSEGFVYCCYCTAASYLLLDIGRVKLKQKWLRF